MAVSGSTILLGAWGHDQYAGRVYVFTQTRTGWKQTDELRGSDTIDGDRFGTSLALQGNTAVVGALGHVFASGRAYVFVSAGTGWIQTAELSAPNTLAIDWFGKSVALSGNTIAVGAPYSGHKRGHAYVFIKQGNSWIEAGELVGTASRSANHFGNSVAVDGNIAFVGAYGSTASLGAYARAAIIGQVYVFDV